MSEFMRIITTAMVRLGLSPGSGPIIVALSGGADSVALLAALSDAGYKCIAAHCDFHLRGEESERDRRHARSVADMLDADYEEVHFDVEEYRRLHGVSVEMACRELRYDWFRELSGRYGGIPIAVAHHHDDNVETMFLNLLRGTGISGLTGMKPRNAIIIRPMLEATRAMIEDYLASRGIGYVVDSSNLQNDVKRNRIRNLVLPLIHKQFPDSDRGFASTMDNLSRTDSLYRELLSERRSRYVSDNGSRIDVARLVSEVREAPTMLYELIRDRGFNYTQSANIISALSGETTSGRRFYSSGWTAMLDRGMLVISRSDSPDDVAESFTINLNDTSLQAPGLRISRIGNDALEFDRTGMTLFLDPSVLEGDPHFEIRHWREGDRLAPFGMKGTRLVSDIFSDAKLSVSEKHRIWILTRNDLVLWVVGLRTSRHFCVTDHSGKVIRIRFESDKA